MVEVTSFPTMWTKCKCVQTSRLTEFVQDIDVGIDVVGIVCIVWIVFAFPILGQWHRQHHPPLGSRLIVDCVKANDLQKSRLIFKNQMLEDNLLQEDVQLWM